MQCAVIGLGEAGRIYADALVAAGHAVSGYDPGVPDVPGVRMASSASEAVSGAEVVLVLTAARLSPVVAAEVVPALAPATAYLDMTSGSPQEMELLDVRVTAGGASFGDVAILGPVPLQGPATPLMVSGAAAPAAADLFATIGAPVEVVQGPGGQAMAHKLLRSVFMKGLAALVCEATAAGRAAGLEPWIKDQMANQLAGDGAAVVTRFLVGTEKHAVRRAEEMRASRSYLQALGAHHVMTDGTVALLERCAAVEVQHG